MDFIGFYDADVQLPPPPPLAPLMPALSRLAQPTMLLTRGSASSVLPLRKRWLMEQLSPQLAGLKGGRGERLTALHAEFSGMVDSFDVVPTCGGVCFVMFGHLGVAGASARCCPYPWDPTATLNGAANRRFHAERAGNGYRGGAKGTRG